MTQWFIKFIMIISYLATPHLCLAKGNFISSFDFDEPETKARYHLGSEFMSGKEPGIVMMDVNLWGAVKQPGIHHIPIKTDLIKLLSYAGGPTEKAILEEVLIKRQIGAEQKKIAINLAQVLHSQNKYNLVLQPDDIVVVPVKEPILSNDTLLIAGFVATIMTAVVAAAIVSNQD